MIIGIGTDIASIERFKDNLEQFGMRFADKILSEAELAIFEHHSQPAQYLASRFAAKEAAAKALGTGFRDGLTLRDISILSNEIGRPTISFTGKAQLVSDRLEVKHMHVSLSHEKEFALAFVILSA